MLPSARRPPNAKAARNAAIFHRAVAGAALALLSRQYGASVQRVPQIVWAGARRRARPGIGGRRGGGAWLRRAAGDDQGGIGTARAEGAQTDLGKARGLSAAAALRGRFSWPLGRTVRRPRAEGRADYPSRQPKDLRPPRLALRD